MSEDLTQRTSGLTDVDGAYYSRQMRSTFTLLEAPIIVKYPILGGTFKADWLAAIEEVENFPTDETMDDQQEGMKNAMTGHQKAILKHFQDNKFLITGAFSAGEPFENEFGFDDYDAAARSPREIPFFLRAYKNGLTKYTTELTTQMMNVPATLAVLAGLETAFNNSFKTYDDFMNQRPLQTQARVNKHNAMWAFTRKASTGGKNTYDANTAEWRLFLLPKNTPNVQSVFTREIGPMGSEIINGLNLEGGGQLYKAEVLDGGQDVMVERVENIGDAATLSVLVTAATPIIGPQEHYGNTGTHLRVTATNPAGITRVRFTILDNL